MIEPGQVTCVIPTRGDVDMTEILLSLLPYGEVIVADNSLLPVDLGIYARFAAAMDAKFDVIYTQDDDIIFPTENQAALLDLYKPGVVVSAYPQPWNIPWVSTGAIFDKALVEPAFEKYRAHYPFDEFLTHKAADAVFCLLTESVEVHPMPYVELPWATAAGRVHTSDGWYDRDRPLAWDRCHAIK